MTLGELLARVEREGHVGLTHEAALIVDAIHQAKARMDGRKGVLIDQLFHKFGRVPQSALTRIDAANWEQLDPWIANILTAKTVDEVFAGSPG